MIIAADIWYQAAPQYLLSTRKSRPGAAPPERS